jgi:hypothetical protein
MPGQCWALQLLQSQGTGGRLETEILAGSILEFPVIILMGPGAADLPNRAAAGSECMVVAAKARVRTSAVIIRIADLLSASCPFGRSGARSGSRKAQSAMRERTAWMRNRAMPDARARDGASATFGQTGCIAGRKRGLSHISPLPHRPAQELQPNNAIRRNTTASPLALNRREPA